MAYETISNADGTTTTTITQVRTWRLGLLTSKGEEINKRAAKLGFPPIRFTVSERYTIGGRDEAGRVISIPVVDIAVTGVQIKVPGFTTVGAVEVMGDAALVHHLPGGEDFDLSSYRNWDGTCDHCRTRRSRKSAFVLLGEDGQFTVVGQSCYRDFTGNGLDPVFLARYAAFFSDDLRGTEEGFVRGQEAYSPLSVLVATVTCARVFGYTSKKQAMESEGLTATAWRVAGLFDRYETKDQRQMLEEIEKHGGFTDEDGAKALEILEWAKAVNPKSDYLWNLKALAQQGFVGRKRISYLASAYGSFAAEQARNAAPKEPRQIPQGFVGKVGERIVLEAKVERVHYTEGMYGCTTILSLVDAEGHKLTWFASGSRDFEVGQTVVGKATIKLHKQDAKWGDSTILTRCAF